MIKKGKYDLSWECKDCGALFSGEVLLEEDVENLEEDPLDIECPFCSLVNEVGLIPIEEKSNVTLDDFLANPHVLKTYKMKVILHDGKETIKEIPHEKTGFLYCGKKKQVEIYAMVDKSPKAPEVEIQGSGFSISPKKGDMQNNCPKCGTILETNYYPFERGYQDSCPNTECDYISELYAKPCFGTCDLNKAVCWLCLQKGDCKRANEPLEIEWSDEMKWWKIKEQEEVKQ